MVIFPALNVIFACLRETMSSTSTMSSSLERPMTICLSAFSGNSPPWYFPEMNLRAKVFAVARSAHGAATSMTSCHGISRPARPCPGPCTRFEVHLARSCCPGCARARPPRPAPPRPAGPPSTARCRSAPGPGCSRGCCAMICSNSASASAWSPGSRQASPSLRRMSTNVRAQRQRAPVLADRLAQHAAGGEHVADVGVHVGDLPLHEGVHARPGALFCRASAAW